MKVAIAGFGVEGKSNYRYFVERGDDVTIIDEQETPKTPLPPDAKVMTGPGVFTKLDGFDLVVRTAGLSPRSIKTDGSVWSATNEFFAKCSAPIIGVTGTKGKGTTCSLIAAILRASGHTVHLVGNIGVPALDVLDEIAPEDVVVYELSSFQLWDLEASPRIAVVLMIEPDHLDVHSDMEDYLSAKSHIVLHQSTADTVIYHPTNPESAKVVEGAVSHKVRYAIPEDGQVYVQSNTFFVQDKAICDVEALQIPGKFNQDNACAAISAALAAGASLEFVEAGLRSFTGLPHRLKFVRTVDEVMYFDDSIATTPGSAMAALGSFPGPKVIILGGSDKGAGYSEVVDKCRETKSKVVAIGQTGAVIAKLCKEQNVEFVRQTGGMSEVVASAAKLSQPGGTVILSPASASFDQYSSYTDRGEKFIAAVEAL